MKKVAFLTDVICDKCKQPIRSELPHGGYVECFKNKYGNIYCMRCKEGKNKN